MRIRKHRTSSQVPVTPKYFEAPVFDNKFENGAHLKRHIDTPDPQPVIPVSGIEPQPVRSPPLDVDLDAAAEILKSLNNQSASHQIRIRDFVLKQGGTTRSGESEHLNCFAPRPSGSESETGPANLVRRTFVEEAFDVRPVQSTSTGKVFSDRKGFGGEIESAQDRALVKFEPTDDVPARPIKTAAPIAESDSGLSKKAISSRKRQRRKAASGSSLAQERVIGSKKLDAEEYVHPELALTLAPKAEQAAGKPSGKDEAKVQHKGKESSEKTSPVAFPNGWSYRGLAQIAEHHKNSQGKQCGRTDGRAWRCPLKVQEGSTLCEHHLSKFRLKKLCKTNKKQKLAPPHPQPQQQQTPPAAPLSPSPPCSRTAEVCEMAQSTSSQEDDAPLIIRRRHKTMKLSVL